MEAIQAAKRLANVFGRRIVVYRNERRPWIGGIVNRDHDDIIFLNIDSRRPYWTVTGHELWHHIQIDRPDLAKQVWEVLEPDLIDYERYKQARLKDGYTLDEVQNELIGDFLGDSMGDPHFWEKLANRQPSVFREFAEAVREWLSKLVAAIKRHDFSTDQYIRDIEGAQSVLADAISRFISENKSKIGPREMADPNQNFYDHGR